MEIDKNLIRNFLTIRYNPVEKPLVKKASPNEFSDSTNDTDGILTENLLLDFISKSIKNDEKPIAVSLSSGIDSSLCLALLRKSFPTRKIISICGVFENDNDESIKAKRIANDFDSDFKVSFGFRTGLVIYVGKGGSVHRLIFFPKITLKFFELFF